MKGYILTLSFISDTFASSNGFNFQSCCKQVSILADSKRADKWVRSDF